MDVLDALREWILQLCAITILLGVLETLLPEGNTQKFVRVVAGLVVVCVALIPILRILTGMETTGSGF